MFRDIHCVLFDLDGTLIDSAPDLGMAVDEMRVERGMPSLSPESYRAYAGSGARGMLDIAFGIGHDDPTFAALRQEFFQRYERRLTHATRPFEGSEDLVVELSRRGLRWGVVTNKSQRFTVPLISQFVMFRSAGVVVCGDTTPFTKPHPAPLLEALRVIGMSGAYCMYVGDDERDMIAGRAVGMVTVAARYGYLGAGAQVANWPADAVIDRPLELLNLLESA